MSEPSFPHTLDRFAQRSPSVFAILAALLGGPMYTHAQSTRPVQRATSQPSTTQTRSLAQFSGLVKDPKGAPISGLKVTLRRAHFPQESVEVTTDAQGKWQLKHLAHGAYWLAMSNTQHAHTKLLFLLTRPRKLDIQTILPIKPAPQKDATQDKSKLPTPKIAKAPTSPPPSPRDANAANPIKAAKAARQRPQHTITPWMEGALNRLYHLRNHYRRRSSLAFRKGMEAYRRGGSYRRFTFDWEPFLAQIKGQLMVTTDPTMKHTLELLSTSLFGYRLPLAKQKALDLRLIREIPPTSPAWSIAGYSVFTGVIEGNFLRSLPESKQYAAQLLTQHPNPGLRLLIRERLLMSLYFKKRFGKSHIDTYRKVRRPIDRRWQNGLQTLLQSYQGKTLTSNQIAQITAKLKALTNSYTMELLTNKKLSYYHRAYFMRRYIQPHLQAKNSLQVEMEGHLDAIKTLCKQYPHKSFTKRLQRALWRVHPTMKKGKEIPPFQMALLEQKSGKKTFTEADFQGKHTLMIFWATWCGPCVKKMPMLHKLHKRFGPRGLQMISISIDKKPEKVHAYRKTKWPIPWNNAILSTDTQRAASDLFEVAAIPKMFLINPKGHLLEPNETLRSEDKLFAILEKLYPQAPMPPPARKIAPQHKTK